MKQNSKSIHAIFMVNIYRMISQDSKKKWIDSWWFALLMGCSIGFVNGFWGGGGGMLCVPVLVFLLGEENKKAHATTIFVMLFLSIVSFIIYWIKGSVEFDARLWIITGSFVVGGAIGAFCLKKINSKVLSVLFAIVMIVAGVRMVWV